MIYGSKAEKAKYDNPTGVCNKCRHEIYNGYCITCGNPDELVVPKGAEFSTDFGTNVDSILEQRGDRYGNFQEQGYLSQRLKNVFHQHIKDRTDDFDEYQIEAIEMILHKIARIGNGDPWYKDSWVDIAGYATLVANTIE